MRNETLGRVVLAIRSFSAAKRQGESKMLRLLERLKIWYLLPILTLVVLAVLGAPTYAQTSHPSLAFPFSAGHDWKIAPGGGYNNGAKHGGIGFEYARYALDFHRKEGSSGGSLVLAPTGAFYINRQFGSAYKCIDLAIDRVSETAWLWLEVCHVDFESYLNEGYEDVPKGQLLGTIAYTCSDGSWDPCAFQHVHLAVHISPAVEPWGAGQRDPVPFVPEYNLTLDGQAFYPNGEVNQWGGYCCYQSSLVPACMLPSTATTSGAHVARVFVSSSDICQPGGGDTIPPETSASLNGTVGNNGWHVSPVGGVLSASDNEGVAHTYYQVNAGSTVEASSFSLSEDGIYEVCFWSVDINGNVEAAKCVQISIDQTPPVTTGTASGSRDMLGVFRSPVDNEFSATDNLSGVESTNLSFDSGSTWNPYSGVFTLGANGVYEYLFRSIDVAGNVELSKLSGTIDIQRFGILTNSLSSDRATTLQVTGITRSNGDASFTNNTTVYLDVLEYMGQLTQSGNVSLTFGNLIQTTEPVQMPLYPLSFYKGVCTFIQGPITVVSTSPAYNECWYVDGDVTLQTTGATGNLTIVSEGVIYDRSTNSHLSAWDATNGVLFWARRGYSTVSTGAVYSGVVYAPFSNISGAFTNATLNGAQFARSVSLGSGTTLNAQQAAGFPVSTLSLPLVVPTPVSPNTIYVSSTTGGTAGTISFGDEDVLVYNREADTYAMYIDGSDIGLANTDIDAFAQLSDGTILLSFDGSISITGLGTVYDADIVRFTPTSLGSNTAGSFAWYFDASDVGLTTSDEDVDAIGFTPDGKLVVSTLGSFSVSGASGNDEDLIVFTATQLGATTSGTWAMYFDGSDVGLNESSYEDVNGVWIDNVTGQVFLTTVGSFSVNGVSGDGADIFVCTPGSLGPNTVCTYGPGLYWDGSKNGFAGEVLDSIEIQK